MAFEMAKMRALVFTAAATDTSTSRVDELDTPVPGRGQVSIDVEHAGVNFKDVMARRGDPGYVTDWPFVPGLDVAGYVRALGADATGLNVGDRVAAYTGAGGLAEVAIAEADLTVAVPAGLDLQRAAAAPGALVSAALLVGDVGRLRAGETLLVHGATGGVGQAVAQLAHLAGAGLVLGTVGSPSRVKAGASIGYDAIFVRDSKLAENIRERTSGNGVDLVLDPQGTTLLDLDLQVAAAGANIILFGNASGAPLRPLPSVERLFAANASVAGFSLAALVAAAPARVANALKEVLENLAAGNLDIDYVTVDGLANAAEAQQALAEGRSHGKQIVDIAAGH